VTRRRCAGERSGDGDDLYQSEIAGRVGVSATHVARVLTRSIEALREATTQPDPAA
jgi:hypothetical protein